MKGRETPPNNPLQRTGTLKVGQAGSRIPMFTLGLSKGNSFRTGFRNQAYHPSKPARPETVSEEEQPPKLAHSGTVSSRISGGLGGHPD
jgi:hypothetical protein